MVSIDIGETILNTDRGRYDMKEDSMKKFKKFNMPHLTNFNRLYSDKLGSSYKVLSLSVNNNEEHLYNTDDPANTHLLSDINQI